MTTAPIDASLDVNASGDNAVSAFQIEGQPVRGRSLRMGAAINDALKGHDYPEVVAGLLGEAIMVSALMAHSLKFKGRLLVQALGTNDGAVSMLIAECTTAGNVRAYARYDEPSLERILAENAHPNAHTLMGGGTFAMTIDQGPDMDNYQGISAIEGDHLSDCAEHYFAQSEQIPTKIRMATAQLQSPGEQMSWRGGAIMIQQIAGDDARGDTSDSWDTARALIGTVSDTELVDPQLPTETLLYRLFHEEGVRLEDLRPVNAQCSCARERLLASILGFPKEERDTMFEDGEIKAKCDFCATEYVFTPADFVDADERSAGQSGG